MRKCVFFILENAHFHCFEYFWISETFNDNSPGDRVTVSSRKSENFPWTTFLSKGAVFKQ
jgi:hypothetical protein